MEDKNRKPGTPQAGKGQGNRSGQDSNLDKNRNQDTSKGTNRKVAADQDSELDRTDENEVPDTSKQEERNQDKNLKR